MTNPASATSSIACLRMRIKIITGVVYVGIVLSPRPASAEKLTLACTFEDGEGNVGRERDVNQVFIDTERPQVDLRIAQTMGTNDQIDWSFQNDAVLKDNIQLVSEGSKISVVAIRFGYAILINFDRVTGLLNWMFADGSRAFRYRCR